MKSAQGKILYIGKASSLRKRVGSYFQKKSFQPKTAILVKKIKDIDFILCGTEAQALILEACLIKEKKPKYNIVLRDGKNYPYIEITNEDFPRILVSRPKTKNSSIFFGPYTSAKIVKDALKMIRRVFPYRSCLSIGKGRPGKPCFYYHLNLCPAPLSGGISKFEYKKNIQNICRILSGEKRILIRGLEKEMSRASARSRFEEAARLRDRLFAVYNLYSGRQQLHQIIFLKELLHLRKLPLVIEAVDVSNIQGKESTASVVVFTDGLPQKSSYRRYHIKGVNKQDDYRMICEVVRRRYHRLKQEGKPLPQLLIVDGGRAHADGAARELRKLHCSIAIVAIAKKNEELWLPEKKGPIVISRDNPSLQLIQRLRDEAHRFARKYHLLLRKKKMVV